jgi:hypothetical protein
MICLGAELFFRVKCQAKKEEKDNLHCSHLHSHLLLVEIFAGKL